MIFQHEDTFPSLGVYNVWESGYHGNGIHIGVLDDGVEPDHPDLVQNYVGHLVSFALNYSFPKCSRRVEISNIVLSAKQNVKKS